MLHLLLRCKKFSGWIVWPHLARWRQWMVPQTRGVGCTQSPLRPVTQSHGYRSRNPEKASHSYSKSSIISDWPVDNWIMEINFHSKSYKVVTSFIWYRKETCSDFFPFFKKNLLIWNLKKIILANGNSESITVNR